MTLLETIRQRILKFLKLEQYDNNPNSTRLTFINDDDVIKAYRAREAKVWAYGDSSELDNFYREESINSLPMNPIYTENIRQYFRAKSVKEAGVKRVHSGLPHAIIETIVNVVGVPRIYSKDKNVELEIEKILKSNDFVNILNQKQLPMTLIEGWGAYKVNIDKNLSNAPIIQYYEAEDVEFVTKYNKVIGIIYKDYYKYKGKNYVLLETRRIANGDSYIEYELYVYQKSNEVTRVPLNTIPELSTLPADGYTIPNFNKILGVPCAIFFDPLNKDYGRSIFMGKIDLFDDLDQILSQESQTVRVSTPVEYYKVDALKRGANGQVVLPNLFNRQYVEAPEGIPNGDGYIQGDQIKTTQPELNFEEYDDAAMAKLDFILTGLIAPATLGINISSVESAAAHKEKEKITFMTRNNIIDREEKIVKDLVTVCLVMQEFMDKGVITKDSYDFSVVFDEFATPTLEEKLNTWGNAYNAGIASERMVITSVYGDNISDEEHDYEINYMVERAKNPDIKKVPQGNKPMKNDKDIIPTGRRGKTFGGEI